MWVDGYAHGSTAKHSDEKGAPKVLLPVGQGQRASLPPAPAKAVACARQHPNGHRHTQKTATLHQGCSLQPIIPQNPRRWVTVSLQFGYSPVILPRRRGGVAGHRRERRPLSRSRRNGQAQTMIRVHGLLRRRDLLLPPIMPRCKRPPTSIRELLCLGRSSSQRCPKIRTRARQTMEQPSKCM